MFACLIFGDSLADGIAAAVNARYPQHCEVRAVRGAASTAMLRWSPPGRRYDTTVLSIGSNDDIGASDDGSSTKKEASARRSRGRVIAAIAYLRRTLPSQRVIWIMPYERRRAAVVQTIAFSFGDEVLDIQAFPSRDGLHPISYQRVARALLR